MTGRTVTGDIDTAKLIAQATTRVANVMIRKYGAGMSEETEEQANVLAVAALGEIPDALEAAEAERDALQGDVDKLVGKIGGLTGEIRRLREALEQIESDIHPARPTDEERPRWLDENSVWWNHLSPQEIARAALAGSGE